jgi:hypothetical protein
MDAQMDAFVDVTSVDAPAPKSQAWTRWRQSCQWWTTSKSRSASLFRALSRHSMPNCPSSPRRACCLCMCAIRAHVRPALLFQYLPFEHFGTAAYGSHVLRMPSMSDPARKRTLADWVVRSKKQVVKLYALAKWARDADAVQKCMVCALCPIFIPCPRVCMQCYTCCFRTSLIHFHVPQRVEY